MPARYPPYNGSRVSIAVGVRAEGAAVAGRLRRAAGGLELVDRSGRVKLESAGAPIGADGDWVSGRLTRCASGCFRLESLVVHAPRLAPSPDPALEAKLTTLQRRAAILASARDYFRSAGFLEVDTPARVDCPGLEPHLEAFPAGGRRFLITSPELHLKRLLAAGAERLVEFSRAFRDEEFGPWHSSEFLLIEWYRSFSGLQEIERDCEALIRACAATPELELRDTLGGCDLAAPFERTTVRTALFDACGLDLADLSEKPAMAAAVAGRGHPIGHDDSWDDLFFRLWVGDVEPGLGQHRPVFVHDYPASQAALARTRRETWGEVAERFELYIRGVELANAFDELNDPVEQRRRHEADREARRASGRTVFPLDERFLAALESGMPPASGIALGFDRLVAVLCGLDQLEALLPFGDEESR